MIKAIFDIKDIDSHRVIYLFGKPVLRIRQESKNVAARKATKYGLNTSARDKKIIVSLTSFPARINQVHHTIETILTQTVKPDKLILWLCQEEFPNKEEDLPKKLLALQQLGLTIEWCEPMLAFQKLIPSIRKYPEDIIITVDDDFYYPETLVEDLYIAYLANPNYIYANRIWRGFLEGNEFKQCSNRLMYSKKFEKPSFYNLLMGYGGVLYPPHSLSEKALDVKKFKEIIPTNDDIWAWAMSVLAGTKTCQLNGYDMSITTVKNTQQVSLSKINKKNCAGIGWEEGYSILIKEYPQILERLRSEAGNE